MEAIAQGKPLHIHLSLSPTSVHWGKPLHNYISLQPGELKPKGPKKKDLKDAQLRIPFSLAAILCTGGADVVRKEAWLFYRTNSSVRLCWGLEEPKGPKKVFETGTWVHWYLLQIPV